MLILSVVSQSFLTQPGSAAAGGRRWSDSEHFVQEVACSKNARSHHLGGSAPRLQL